MNTKLIKVKSVLFFTKLGVIISLFSGCDLFLDIDPPKTELATDLVFNSNNTANAAITSLYARMATSNGSPFSTVVWLSGLSADEFLNYGTNTSITEYYTNSLVPTNNTVASYFWTPYYNIIYQANAIIEGLSGSSAVSDNVKKQIIGEAKFVRAFYHFYLTNFFGDIPIITSTDYRTNALLGRSPQGDVYKQIINDLIDAKEVVNHNYVGADAVTSTTERVRPNKSAISALLARGYLYTGDYQKAEQEATTVISNSLYALPSDIGIVFQKNSKEAIWQVQPIATAATTHALWFVLSGRPGTGLERSITISDKMLDVFDPDDVRLSEWVGKIEVSGTTFTFPNKHKVTASNTTEYNMVMRLAEQYLIRAEARIRQENVTNGLADLNALRSRANVETYKIETLTSDPLLLVEEERLRELFAEGHRWFDLRRTGRIDEVMSQMTPTKGGDWKSGFKYYPIPQTERNNNPNLSQNDDY